MEMINKFYATDSSGLQPNEYQLKELSNQQISYITGGRISNDWGVSEGAQRYYRKTTADDYDISFKNTLLQIKPAYYIENFLNYHLENYTTVLNGEKSLFLKHIKFVILPKIPIKPSYAPYIELVNIWISNQTDQILEN